MKQSEAIQQILGFAQALGMVVFVVVLYFARDVLLPLALGVLLAFLLTPIVNRLQRLGMSNVTSVVVTSGLVMCILSASIYLIGLNMSSFSDEWPTYRSQLREKLVAVQNWTKGMGGRLKSITEEVNEVIDRDKMGPHDLSKSEESDSKKLDLPEEPKSEDLQHEVGTKVASAGSTPGRPLYIVDSTRAVGFDFKNWAGGAASVLGPVGTAGLVLVIALFALLYRDDLRDRIVSVISKGNYVATTDAVNEASQKIGSYLMAQVILNVCFGVMFGIGLMVIGFFFAPDGKFPYVILLGALAGLFRFIPYIGPLIGAGLPIGMSFLLFPGFQVAFAVFALIVLMELISNNIVEPWVYGVRTGVSPMAIILAAIFWGWLWGPIGLLLATPLTVCLVVLGKYVPRFEFLSTLLSDELKVDPHIRAYQRVLSTDQHKIEQFFSERSQEPISETIDQVLVPLARLIQSDKSNEVDQLEIYDKIKKALEAIDLISPEDEKLEVEEAEGVDPLVLSESETSAPTNDEHVSIAPTMMVVPARHAGEEVIGRVIAHSIRTKFRSVFIDTQDVMDREAERVCKYAPEVVTICVIPPQGISQAQYWCSTLRKLGYKGTIVVACFGKFRNYDRLFSGFRRRGANWVMTSGNQLLGKLARIGDQWVKRQRGDMKSITKNLKSGFAETNAESA